MSEVTLGGTVRVLNAEQLGFGYGREGSQDRAVSAPDAPQLDPDDPEIRKIINLLGRYSGVLLSGPPGTSKSYQAVAAAKIMTQGDNSRASFVQFHPSYQYEDFIEGYRPNEEKGGFERRSGVFMELCDRALSDENNDYVLVIDELSRGDAARIFGETLTYVEKSKRMMEFELPSGRPARIPANVHIIATMNPLDRGVDEVDAAFERRFAKLEMLPSENLLRKRLIENGLEENLREQVVSWFLRVNGRARDVPAASLGHAYFWDVTSRESLRDVWEYQIKHHIARAFSLDLIERDNIVSAWERIFEASDDTKVE